MAHAWNGCSQSSRLLLQARRIEGSGDENGNAVQNFFSFWLSAIDNLNLEESYYLFQLHLSIYLPLSLNFQNLAPSKLFTVSLKTYLYKCVLPKLSGFCSYATFYFIVFFIFVDFLVIVYFVLLKHCLHHVKHCIIVMNIVGASFRIRIAQWIHVYDVKSCFAHGWQGVGVEKGNSLKGKNAKIFCLPVLPDVAIVVLICL